MLNNNLSVTFHLKGAVRWQTSASKNVVLNGVSLKDAQGELKRHDCVIERIFSPDIINQLPSQHELRAFSSNRKKAIAAYWKLVQKEPYKALNCHMRDWCHMLNAIGFTVAPMS